MPAKKTVSAFLPHEFNGRVAKAAKIIANPALQAEHRRIVGKKDPVDVAKKIRTGLWAKRSVDDILQELE
jgi:hypothetical protein